jgi:predicted outer membrane repeat protein
MANKLLLTLLSCAWLLACTPDAAIDPSAHGADASTDGTDSAAPVACSQDLPCGDGNACTLDVCGVDGECVFIPSDAACSDGDECSQDDRCDGGQCTGTAKDCEDGNGCTLDSCAGGTCNHAMTTAPCDDGEVCTNGDACKNGTCVGSWTCACKSDADCDDSNACTKDACADHSCSHVGVEGPCDDGSVCTSADACAGGVCTGKAKVCEDGEPCTVDGCDAKSGCTIVNAPTETPCEDGKACTIGDHCVGGSCAAGDGKCPCLSNFDCDDGNFCTVDVCKGTGGCTSLPAVCDDDNPCTVDVCAASTGDCTFSADDSLIPEAAACGKDDCAVAMPACKSGKSICLWQSVAPDSDGKACKFGKGVCQAGFCVLANDSPPDMEAIADGGPVKSGNSATLRVAIHDPDGSFSDIAGATIDLSSIGGSAQQGLQFDLGQSSADTAVFQIGLSTQGLGEGVYLLPVHAVDAAGEATETVVPLYVYTGKILHVGKGQPYTSLHDGIAAALDGDAVVVHDGVYSGNLNKNLAFYGKHILVMGQHDAGKTVVDCQGVGRAFSLYNSGETAGAVIARMTFQNCTGGAIRLHVDQPGVTMDARIVECAFLGNSNSDGGGGILVVGTSVQATIAVCRFLNNSSSVSGGAIAADTDNTVVLQSDAFFSNVANDGGAFSLGKAVYDGSAVVKDCLFDNNGGSTIFVSDNSALHAINSVWKNGYNGSSGASCLRAAGANSVTVEGAKVSNNPLVAFSFVDVHAVNISGSRFTGNFTAITGICVDGATISDCSFSKNQARAVALNDCSQSLSTTTGLSTWTISHCNFSENASSSDGGAVYMESGNALSAEHCVFDGNKANGNGGAIAVTGNMYSTDVAFHGENLLLTNNSAGMDGGAISVNMNDFDEPKLPVGTFQIVLRALTVVANQAIGRGGGLGIQAGAVRMDYSLLTNNSAIATPFPGQNVFAVGAAKSNECAFAFCAVDTTNDGFNDTGAKINEGVFGSEDGIGNIDLVDPLFLTSSKGSYYLEQKAAGQSQQSVCVDPVGKNPLAASNSALVGLTTRVDGVPDTGTLDIGYHYAP